MNSERDALVCSKWRSVRSVGDVGDDDVGQCVIVTCYGPPLGVLEKGQSGISTMFLSSIASGTGSHLEKRVVKQLLLLLFLCLVCR